MLRGQRSRKPLGTGDSNFGRKVVNNLANLLGWLLQFKLDLAYHRHKLIRWLFAKKHFCNPPPIDLLNRGELRNG